MDFDQKLASVVLEKKLISEQNLESVRHRAEAEKVNLETALFESDQIPRDVLGILIAELYEVPFVNLAEKKCSRGTSPDRSLSSGLLSELDPL